MTVLFFDTETTGFFNDRQPVDHPTQPYIVQLAAQLCDDDGVVIAGFSTIIDPGIPIPAQASNVHGITDDKAKRFGVTIKSALEWFSHLYGLADAVVAHNIKFDKGVVEAAIARQYGRVKSLDKAIYCTMDAASPIVNLPPTERMIAAGFNKPKPPKLEECIKHFFSEDLEGAHDAMIDVVACRRVYFHLKSLKAVP